jgi:hypothetical protein
MSKMRNSMRRPRETRNSYLTDISLGLGSLTAPTVNEHLESQISSRDPRSDVGFARKL